MSDMGKDVTVVVIDQSSRFAYQVAESTQGC